MTEVIGQAGPLFTLLGTFGGVWAVLKLFQKFQADFSERYRQELVAERTRRVEAETTADAERIKRISAEEGLSDERGLRLAAQQRCHRLALLLAAHDIPDPDHAG